ncbi:MAG: pyridoxamine 5'-phosphate oxidase family protein [Methylacidiphilales bacterium]|nr:pyridoxamine 5'-phosphate oxidase family protein [Candidatus Methylacidiphilales bacterium]NJR17638.1 pyridoxamine 5'-phosphate oxidase family protein [Calothrix sp. CSU_2_0]
MNNFESEHNQEKFTSTQRSQIKRIPQRGNYDRTTIYQILDEGLVCHVGFIVDNQPFVIPTAYGRINDKLYIHGSPASRMLRSLIGSVEVCVTVTLIDGLVLARSAFHHSMNYRSVVIFGQAEIVRDRNEKLAALKAFTEHILPGRWDDVRQPNPQELQGTMVLALPLIEASAKIRTGMPIDDEADYNLPVWAGILPLQLTTGNAIPDTKLPQKIALPAYLNNCDREAASLMHRTTNSNIE